MMWRRKKRKRHRREYNGEPSGCLGGIFDLLGNILEAVFDGLGK